MELMLFLSSLPVTYQPDMKSETLEVVHFAIDQRNG